ncbi:DNA cytosine methyltransferase [Humidesulfovibrio idahonensis]
MAFSPPSLYGLALCAGAGGLELGLHIAAPGYRTVCYVERDAHAASTLVARMEDQTLDQAPLWSDVRAFDGRPWRGSVDILTAGYPCQPFSLAGRQLGQADPRHLWPDVARIVDEVRPEWVFCENVIGHLHLGFDVVARDLEGLGYRVAAGVFSAREVGAGHFRRRLFILAHAVGLPVQASKWADCRGRKGQVRVQASDDTVRNGDRLDPVLAVTALNPGTGAGAVDRDLPLFAPGPGDIAAWSDVLLRDSGLIPALPGDADGMAGWMDRQRLAGNGVCPLAAAYAWQTLSAVLMEAEDSRLRA